MTRSARHTRASDIAQVGCIIDASEGASRSSCALEKTRMSH